MKFRKATFDSNIINTNNRVERNDDKFSSSPKNNKKWIVKDSPLNTYI